MDLTWRRPRYKYARYDGCSITSAGELQEKQLEAGIDYCRRGGCYDLEQSISLREYLENNPDSYDEIKELIQEGRLNVLGGGESVIDNNMPCGETIARNHMYSLRWLQSEFGVRPRFAECPDTFGLSGGLPALFVDLGYEGMGHYSRIFGKAKPFWRGISGDIFPLATTSLHQISSCQFGGLVVDDPYATTCDICKGEGCPACGYRGAFGRFKPVSDFAVQYGIEHINAKRKPDGDFCLIICEEESAVSIRAMNVLKRIADELHMNLHPIGFEELTAIANDDLLKTYHSGNIPEEDIDPRQEGNPVTAGCYTTRIKLKQRLRKCEAALLACERIAVATEIKTGEKYPAKTIEKLWRKLEYLYFHDAAPASHSDDVYDELMDISEMIIKKANRIINRSVLLMNNCKSMAEESGTYFVVYNPLEFDVENVRLQGGVEVDEFVTDGRIVDSDGNEMQMLSIKHAVNTPLGDAATIEFFGSLPAFGYKVFKFIPSNETQKTTVSKIKDAVIENEHLRVVFKNYLVDSVVDKHTGATIAGKASFSPIVTDDAGNPWGKTAIGCYKDDAICPDFYLNTNPPHEHSCKMEVQTYEGGKRVTVYVRYSRPDRNLEILDWKIDYDLSDGAKELQVHITTEFDARDLRLSTQIVLPSSPANNMLEHEIPFGKIKRGTPDYHDIHGYADEWPALHYVCAQLKNVNVLVCNSGTPATKLDNNAICIALMRTPTQKLFAFDTDGALDKSEHNFYFTLSATEDRNITPYRRGAALNAFYPSIKGTLPEGKGRYLPLALPNNAPLLALKGAEDTNGYIVRYAGLEENEVLEFASPVKLSNVLEEDKDETLTKAELPPFAIRTYRIV